MTRRSTLASAAALLTVLAVAGCAGNGDLDAEDSPVARYEWQPGSGANQALMEGTLELRDGCLYIVGSGDTEGLTVVPVLTRALASWDSETETLTYAGQDYAMGDEVAAGGGWGEPNDEMTLPDACEPDEWGQVMYVQDDTLAPMDARDL